MPKHIKIFVDNIENLSEYQNLVSLKGQSKSVPEITDVYKKFVKKYYSESNLTVLHTQLSDGLKTSFSQ